MRNTENNGFRPPQRPGTPPRSRQNPPQTPHQQRPQKNAGRPEKPEAAGRRAALEQQKKRMEAEQERRRKAQLRRKAQEKQKKAEEKKRKKAAEARRKAQEKMQKHDERFELTEEERAIRDQMRREEQAYLSRRRRRRAKMIAGRTVIFLCMFVVLLGTFAGLFYLNLIRYEPDARRNFQCVVGVEVPGEKKKDPNAKTFTVAHDKMMRGGTLYLNMTPIVELCEMAVTGDTQELRYISRKADEHVKFMVGSTQVFINGAETRLTAAPVLEGEDLYVPFDFFTSYVSGVSFLFDAEKNKVTVSRNLAEDSDTDLQDISFVIRSDAPMTGLVEYNEFGNTPPIVFTAALDVYEEYMNPPNRDDYLLLVNTAYPLPQTYVPEQVEITDIRRDGRPLQYLDPVVEKAAHAMIMELQANGFVDVNIPLGYRSYGKQRHYYNTTVEEYMKTMTEEQAKTAALSVAQMPGCNPQQAGYSMIMHNLEDASAAFAREPAYAWLAENCWKFGFIIRYPADKTAETGMAFQPYFFTYVGRYHAMRIMEQGISMEEYIAQLEEKNYFGMPYAEFRDQLISKVAK